MWTRTLLILPCAILLCATARADAQSGADPVAARVNAALVGCPQYTIFDEVSAQVSDGVVRLTGLVTSTAKQRDIAAHLARVPGVRSVANDIGILPSNDADAALRVRIAQAIYGHASFWEYASMTSPPIHILVSHGQVRLVGTVATNVERALAQSLAAVDGVTSIRNDLTTSRESNPHVQRR